jgi:hypothetical protein
MAAMAIHQHAVHTHGAHLAERYLDWPAIGLGRRMASDRAGHAAIKAMREPPSNYRSLAGQGKGPPRERALLRRLVCLGQGRFLFARASTILISLQVA